MSSVSPSDGGYQYYQRTVGELEEELQTEARRARQREDERAAKLEQSYKDEIADRGREMEDTINDIKKNSDRYVASERSNARAEVDELKNKTYDRSGRFMVENNTVKRELEEQSRAMDIASERNARRSAESEEDYMQRTEALHRDYQQRIENAVRDTREAIINSSGKTVEERNREYEENRQEAEKRYQEVDRKRIEDLNFQRRSYDKAMDDSQRDYAHRTRGVMASAEKSVKVRREEDARRLERDTTHINESHRDEADQLRSQIKDLVKSEKDYVKGRAQGTSDAVREYENEWRDRERIANDAYQGEVAVLKKQSAETDTYFSRLNSENLREKDVYFSKLLGKQGIENRMMQKQLEDTFNGDREQLEKRMSTERKLSKKQLDTELKESDKLRAVALENQAKTYQDTMLRQRISNQERTDKLERQVQNNQTSQDTSDISPAAEAAVRKSVTKEYDKSFNEERERNKRTTDSMQKEYATRMRETIVGAESERARILRAQAADKSYERNQFLDHLTDTVQDKEAAIHHKEVESRRQSESADRSYANFLERQRREYEDIIQAQKDDSNARIQSIRQQAEFNSKMAQRAFAARQNEITRDVDKKLADQKQEYESKLDEMRSQNLQSTRDAERKYRQSLEEQERIYEQRLSQLEASHKERERYMSQNFEEDLEKVKRSNAMLIQKRS